MHDFSVAMPKREDMHINSLKMMIKENNVNRICRFMYKEGIGQAKKAFYTREVNASGVNNVFRSQTMSPKALKSPVDPYPWLLRF